MNEKARIKSAAEEAMRSERELIIQERKAHLLDLQSTRDRLNFRIQQAITQVYSFRKRELDIPKELDAAIAKVSGPDAPCRNKVVDANLLQIGLLKLEQEVNPHRIQLAEERLADLHAKAKAIEDEMARIKEEIANVSS